MRCEFHVCRNSQIIRSAYGAALREISSLQKAHAARYADDYGKGASNVLLLCAVVHVAHVHLEVYYQGSFNFLEIILK